MIHHPKRHQNHDAPNIKKKYTITIQYSQNYPFSGPKSPQFDVSVLTHFQALKPTHPNINKITLPFSNHFVQLLEIVEDHQPATIDYIFRYQYIPYSIMDSPLLENQAAINDSLQYLCEQLANYRILPEVRLADFGVSFDKRTVKYYLRPNFKCVELSTAEQIRLYTKELKRKFQDLLRQSRQKPLSHKKQKIELITQKIKRLRHSLFKVQMKNIDNKTSNSFKCNSEKQHSENSENYTLTINKEENGRESRVSSDKEHCFEDSYSWRNAKNKKKRTASFQLDEKKPRSESKYKKASWGQKCSIVESDKATVLKQRVSDALLKTQNALNKYQKIRTRSSKKNK